MNIKVYDNFLDEKPFKWVQGSMLGCEINWRCGTVMNPPVDEMLCDEIENIQFCNWIYHNFRPQGPEYELVQPIISHPKLKICSLHRIKANLTMRTSKIVKHGFHTDGTGNYMVAIYYVNTNDGYTEFEDGTKIESIENRLLVFDSSLRHTGTTCTDAKVRCVINFNYHPENYGHTEGS